ncbi:MAG TPA: hypothetical protein VN541_10670, partial [Tepidisphaeraceae bacterium]|nr:hypothetical protein [Tepidisphaeraceae bacterium]
NRKAARREQHEAWRSTIRETVSSDYDLWIADADFSLLPKASATTQPTTQPLPAVNIAFRPAREITGINTQYTEGASCMSPPGDFLYFASNRPGGLGKFDIYRSRIRGEHFDEPENVGPSINSSENEADPSLAYNGFRMYFSSDRPGADGRYHLLVSDSREVYPQRLSRPMPHLGWSWLVLLISLLVLIPLLMFLRGWDERRLSIIQKCLLLSLLVHALITFLLSFIVVTQKVTQFVRAQSELEVAVNLREGQGVEESLAIRNQVSSDLPVSGAAPTALSPVRSQQEPMEAIKPADVTMPSERVAAAHMTIASDAPAPSTSLPELSRTQVAAAAAPTGTLDVKLPSLGGVSQAESDPDPSPVRPAGARNLVSESAPAVPGGAGPSNLNLAVTPTSQRLAPTDLQVASGRNGSNAPARLGDAAGTGPIPSPQVGSSGNGPQVGAIQSTPVAATSEASITPSRSNPVAAKPFARQEAALTGPNARATDTIQLAGGPAAGPSTRPSIQPAAARSSQEGIAALVPSSTVPPAVGKMAQALETLSATPSVISKVESQREAVSSPSMAASTMPPSNLGQGGMQGSAGPVEVTPIPGKSTTELKPHSLAFAPVPRAGVASLAPSNDLVPSPNAITSGIPGPQLGGLKANTAVASNLPPAGERNLSTHAPGVTLAPTANGGMATARSVDITPAPVLASAPVHSSLGNASVPDQPANKPVEVTAAAIQPQIDVSTLT